MKFYIASSFANKGLVQHVSGKLRSAGHTQTYDWTQNERATDEKALHSIGELEKQAVAECNLFIMLLPAGKGSHTELGLALALSKKVYIYSADEIDPLLATTFYYVDGVERYSGKMEAFIERLLEKG